MAERTPTPPNLVNPEPATPRRVGEIASGGKLQSTPSNRGSASASEHPPGARVRDVTASIFADIQHHKKCTVENLLNGMLSLCLPEEHKHDPPADILNKCLDAVLPICNVEVRDCARDSSVKTKAKGRQNRVPDNVLVGLADYLTKWRQPSREDEGYMPLVYAFNRALEALREIDVPLRESTRESTDLLLFHRNDPKYMFATHNSHSSKRKPDLILVSLRAANEASSDGQGSWADRAFGKAGERPKKGFKWSECLSAVEIKWISKQKQKLLPEKYTVRPAKQISPLRTSLYDSREDAPTQLESTQPSAEYSAQVSVYPQSTSQSRASTSLSEVSSSLKRKSEQGEEGRNKRVKGPDTLPRLSAMTQSALYAAERMSDAIWISHAINLVVIDTVAHVWWYDNEGAIQSHGIDFIEDLPYFLVLLLCFERFTPKDWGIVSELKPERKGAVLLPSVSPLEISIVQTNKIRGHFGIVGRTTQMLHVRSQSNHPRDPSKGLKGMDLVFKVYWPEASRASEAEIIDKAHQIARQNDDVKGHLPDLIYSHDFVEYSTKEIRTAFGIETETRSPRVLRVMLFRRLYPITDLTGDKFWTAFWECFRCHHHLWFGGVEHNDISVKNLMYDSANGCGVLNDYDLAHLSGRTRPSGTERTGTMPFMALDLLTEEAWSGRIERLYRHDCESFAWVLLWICCRYDVGNEISDPPLSKFITHDYEECYNAKAPILRRLWKIHPTESYKRFWPVVGDFIERLIRANERRASRDSAAARQANIDPAALQPLIPLEELPIDVEEPLQIYHNVLKRFGLEDLITRSISV